MLKVTLNLHTKSHFVPVENLLYFLLIYNYYWLLIICESKHIANFKVYSIEAVQSICKVALLLSSVVYMLYSFESKHRFA